MLTDIDKVRIEVGDMDKALPILTDDVYQYFLDKNKNNIALSCVDAAKTILFKLSQQADDTVDILTLKGSKVAEQYRLALQLYLRDPSMNPLLNNARAWFGGVSVSEMKANDANPDNNLIPKPWKDRSTSGFGGGYF